LLAEGKVSFKFIEHICLIFINFYNIQMFLLLLNKEDDVFLLRLLTKTGACFKQLSEATGKRLL
jgi:hypothetical protein